MKPWMLAAAVAAGGALIYLQRGNLSMVGSSVYGLPDIDSRDQGGVYKRTYDPAFEAASNRTGVPFALIKSHAIRESSLNPDAYRYENVASGASYGLLQVLWGGTAKRLTTEFGGVSGRFDQWGYPDVDLAMGARLYEPELNALLGALIIKFNLARFNGNLRDAINAYNTGVAESVRRAPHNYVDEVLGYYETLIKRSVFA